MYPKIPDSPRNFPRGVPRDPAIVARRSTDSIQLPETILEAVVDTAATIVRIIVASRPSDHVLELISMYPLPRPDRM